MPAADHDDDGLVLRSNSYTEAMSSAAPPAEAPSSSAGGHAVARALSVRFAASPESTPESVEEAIFGEEGKRWHVKGLGTATDATHKDTSHLPPHPLTKSLLNPITLFE